MSLDSADTLANYEDDGAKHEVTLGALGSPANAACRMS